ncbi:MAG TPA: T9SS type A sorting domain-containing protein [Flavobacteriaceae bacterium]|nr:T9SS type A sorting domain-containing protein [Flavobacteriaceae bacterium]
MKNFTFIVFLVCGLGISGLQGQLKSAGSEFTAMEQQEMLQAAQMQTDQEILSIDQLLVRLDQVSLEKELGGVPTGFTTEEQQVLDGYFSNLSPMTDHVPGAGNVETFNVAVGDHFFDPGGPGGGNTDDIPGNYPNCNCDTFTTLVGASEIEFLYFNVFADFDYLVIYDGTDATGTILFDNGENGINAEDRTLDDMIASHGSATFTSTTGNLHFEFHSSSVVDRGGWDVEIISSGADPFPAPYCGPLTFSSDVEPITLVDIAGINNVTDATVSGSPAHEDFTAMIGQVEQDGSYTITLEGNTNGDFENGLTVFIDWNQNELLNDAGEVYEIAVPLDNTTGTDGQQVTGTIVVPTDAILGETRMRVKKVFLGPDLDPCVPGSSVGQAEDYTLMVSAPTGGGCTDPIITSVDGPETICEGSTATLTAVHDGETLNWYDAATGGNLVGTGSPFETGELTTTTSFWAEAVNTGSGGGTAQTGGARVAPSSNSSSNVNTATNPWGLSFDVSEDFVLNSVDVFLADNTPGDITIQLKDNTLAIIHEVTISAPAGNSSSPVQFTLPLDFFVPAGTDYNLVAESGPVEMIREFSSEHPGFPYPIGTVGTVIGGTINDNDSNATVYYFFYNWTVTPGESCFSERMEEVVMVNPTPALPTGDANQFFEDGETLADLEVTGTNLIWYSDSAGTVVIPDSTVLVDVTTYYVSQSIDGCESELLAITVTNNFGIQDNMIAGFQFYPNPAADMLNVEADVSLEKIVLYNLMGQEVLSHKINSSSSNLNISNLGTGIYFMKIFSNGNMGTYRLIKK